MSKNSLRSKHRLTSLRSVFQVLLQAKVQTLSEMEALASKLGVSTSLVKKMVYKGEGGLDVWGATFEILYDWNEDFFSALKNDLRKKAKVTESDQIWYSIRDELGAHESDLYYLASCAREAFRIQTEISAVKQKRKK